MINITYDSSKLESLIKGLDGVERLFPEQVYVALTASVLDIRNDAIKNAPKDTGTLARSIDWKVPRGSSSMIGYVGSNLVYAKIHEFGGQTGRNHSVTIQGKHYFERAIQANSAAAKERFRKLELLKR